MDYVSARTNIELSQRDMNIIVNGLNFLLREHGHDLSEHAKECYEHVVNLMESNRIID